MIKTKHNYYYVDGVIELHKQLFEVYAQAMSICNDILGNSRNLNCKIPSIIKLFVDFNEVQPNNGIKGYFMKGNRILRFLPIELDKAALFPVHDHNGQTGDGLSIIEIDQHIRNKEAGIIKFIPINNFFSNRIYNISFLPMSDIECEVYPAKLDDIGKVFSNFADLETLSFKDIPLKFLEIKYTLVGKQDYAPFTTSKQIDCVLFAEVDNQHDLKAIKVLRWLPKRKIENSLFEELRIKGGDVFFELGYISLDQNKELHEFMVSNDSRLLFGVCQKEEISIVGGIRIFQLNNFKYPKCLYRIKLK